MNSNTLPNESSMRYRQYRAPKVHGEVFMDPDIDRGDDRIQENRERLRASDSFLKPLQDRARVQLVEDAKRYTSAYRDVSWADGVVPDQPILMAGHQPALFHPGVWFKNFALHRLAESNRALAINLIVDNDVSASSAIRVPTLDSTTGRPHLTSVAYDDAGGGVPYEQTTIQNRSMFDSFDHRVRQAVRGIVDEPCVTPLWEHARAAVARCGVAGCALAQARHGLEGEIGLRTLELPLGVVCRSTAFAEFVLMILTELPRFRTCYNESAELYRSCHGIRSNAHPVPNLAQHDQWFEAPLWIYGNDSPARKPAWVRIAADHLVISDREKRELRIDIGHPKLAAEQLANLVSPNFKIRPRALITTMYARLVLSDLFLHGIGGGKYDQLGDEIAESFFAITPPHFMVISATVQLPGLQTIDFASQIRELKRSLRDMEYQPERFADEGGFDKGLLEQKKRMLGEMPSGPDKHDWHQRLAEVNHQLSSSLGQLRHRVRSKLAKLQSEAAAQSLMASREHPFCVFPLEYLTETFNRLLSM